MPIRMAHAVHELPVAAPLCGNRATPLLGPDVIFADHRYFPSGWQSSPRAQPWRAFSVASPVYDYSPSLANRVGVQWTLGEAEVVLNPGEVLEVIRWSRAYQSQA